MESQFKNFLSYLDYPIGTPLRYMFSLLFIGGTISTLLLIRTACAFKRIFSGIPAYGAQVRIEYSTKP